MQASCPSQQMLQFLEVQMRQVLSKELQTDLRERIPTYVSGGQDRERDKEAKRAQMKKRNFAPENFFPPSRRRRRPLICSPFALSPETASPIIKVGSILEVPFSKTLLRKYKETKLCHHTHKSQPRGTMLVLVFAILFSLQLVFAILSSLQLVVI